MERAANDRPLAGEALLTRTRFANISQCDSVYARDNDNNESYSLQNLQQINSPNNLSYDDDQQLRPHNNSHDRQNFHHDTECLEQPRSSATYHRASGAQEEELNADSVDLLKMLPEAHRCRPQHATCGSSLKLPRVNVPESHEVERLYQPCVVEELPGEPTYSDIYNALHHSTEGRETPASLKERGPIEGRAFITVPQCPVSTSGIHEFHPFYEARQNNQTSTINSSKLAIGKLNL